MCHGKKQTLDDCGIEKEDTLFLLKTEVALKITEPKVCSFNTSSLLIRAHVGRCMLSDGLHWFNEFMD